MPNARGLSLPLVLATAILSGQQTLTIPQIAKKVSPCVVVIEGKTESGESVGSGFLVSKDGKIVTNLHVISHLTTAKVLVPNGDVFDSLTVLATDERRDLAVVKVAGFDLPTLEFGNSDPLAVGQRVVAVGSPLGLEGTVTSGILSAIRESDGYKVLQTDAAVNPGNSGGPLVDDGGRVVGVITFKLRSSENLNFAVPINYVRGLMDNLQQPMTLEQMRTRIRASAAKSEQDNAGPTLNETLQWLKDNIPLGICTLLVKGSGANGVDIPTNVSGKAWILDGCTIQVGSTMDFLRPEDKSLILQTAIRYTVPLWTITSGNVEAGSANDVKCYSGVFNSSSESITLEVFGEVPTRPDVKPKAPPKAHINHFDLNAPDRQTAERMVKAILHAADLCRKKEPF